VEFSENSDDKKNDKEIIENNLNFLNKIEDPVEEDSQ